jgi:hypothetical protein
VAQSKPFLKDLIENDIFSYNPAQRLQPNGCGLTVEFKLLGHENGSNRPELL